MAEAGPLRFLLAPANHLTAERLSTADLAIVQGQGVSSAFALRIVVSHDLGGRFQRVCDATTPRFEPERLWLGVYQPSPERPHLWQLRDRFPLSQARNESCWFYPTHDGHYLSWQRDLQVSLAPGQIAEPTPQAAAAAVEGYSREAIALLWSLLADDTSLTCVGLTYGGRRIDWPLSHSQWAPSASWCTFSVDSDRERPLIVHSRREVCASPASPAQPSTA
ncbi:MAG: hypothetical protein KFB97_09830 [Cyanobium sp. M30B3]|nr:MAG: hypothetical protein KFB97_09830 [Cyanobium sp. M30B3]